MIWGAMKKDWLDTMDGYNCVMKESRLCLPRSFIGVTRGLISALSPNKRPLPKEEGFQVIWPIRGEMSVSRCS